MPESVIAQPDDPIGHRNKRRALKVTLAALLLAPPLAAQVKPAPATASAPATAPVIDSAAQANPLTQPAAPAKAVDAATQASPVTPPPRGESIPAGTTLQVDIAQALDSGKTHNGEHVRGVLRNSVRTSTGRTLPAGTEAAVTVVATVPAGKLESSGEITLQVTRVGSIETLSDVITRRGTPGPKDLPDSTPAKGTDATLTPGTVLTFHIPAIPSPAQ